MGYAITISETEKAYIAGFLDADGTISLTKEKSRNNLKHQIGFDNTNLEVLEWIQKKLQANNTKIYACKSKPTENKKERYMIRLSGKEQLKEILQLLIPYLIRKKTQACLLLEFIQLNSCYKGKRNYQLSMREIEIFENMKSLNKVGVT